jgi:uncharacterized membrane protein
LLVSVIGLISEVLVSYVLDGRWESRTGYVLGQMSPLYGLGTVLMTLAVNPLRGKPVVVQFLVAELVGGMLEYFAGWFFETRYGIVAWSYANQPFNFHGHTSLAMMIIWGAVGAVWVLWMLPLALNLINRMPQNVRVPLTAVACVYILVDSTLTLACLDSWFWRMNGVPISNPLQQFCATYFNDDFMGSRFETMSMWTTLASR